MAPKGLHALRVSYYWEQALHKIGVSTHVIRHAKYTEYLDAYKSIILQRSDLYPYAHEAGHALHDAYKHTKHSLLYTWEERLLSEIVAETFANQIIAPPGGYNDNVLLKWVINDWLWERFEDYCSMYHINLPQKEKWFSQYQASQSNEVNGIKRTVCMLLSTPTAKTLRATYLRAS